VTALLVLLAACIELTRWKARQLERCHGAPGAAPPHPPDARNAWRHGLRIGLHCAVCSANLMLVLLLLGVMDDAVMAAATLAISAERLAPRPLPVAPALGIVLMGTGAVLLARALHWV
jgi:predicted metal-binding membrane protein